MPIEFTPGEWAFIAEALREAAAEYEALADTRREPMSGASARYRSQAERAREHAARIESAIAGAL